MGICVCKDGQGNSKKDAYTQAEEHPAEETIGGHAAVGAPAADANESDASDKEPVLDADEPSSGKRLVDKQSINDEFASDVSEPAEQLPVEESTSVEPSSTIDGLLERISRLDLDNWFREEISAIATNSSETDIDFIGETVGDAGATAIGEGLCKNDTLQTLDLESNSISGAGAVAIAEGLSNNDTLQNLNLSCNTISDAGAVAIAEVLSNNATLQTLDLRTNKISDAGAAAIAEGLRNNATLQTLNINANPITHTGVLALAKAFRWNENLQILSAAPLGSEYNDVNAEKEIGHGEFGSVFLGIYKGKEVVEKKSYTTSNREEVYEQLILLGLPEHPNVVRLPVLSYLDTNSLILEAHKGGSLKNFARNHEDGVPLFAFMGYSHDMCMAIEHLHKHGIIHRDIALRNYVLTEDLLTAILIDFGLSWPIEEEKSVTIRLREKMPFRQCAPEVFVLQYSKAADIWMLGLAMCQLLHRGRQPFSHFRNGQQVMKYLNKKMVVDKRCIPLSFRNKGATRILMNTVKELVVFCCQYDPAERPTATQVVKKIESLHKSVEIQLDEYVEVQPDESVQVQIDEEKEVTKYAPDQSDVESGLNAYNHTDYDSFKTRGRSDYIDLKEDLEEHQHDIYEAFSEDDMEQEEDLESQYQDMVSDSE